MTQKLDLSKSADFAEQLHLAWLWPTGKRVAFAALLFDGRHRHDSDETLTGEITAAGPMSQFMMHNRQSLSKPDLNQHRHFYEESKDEFWISKIIN